MEERLDETDYGILQASKFRINESYASPYLGRIRFNPTKATFKMHEAKALAEDAVKREGSVKETFEREGFTGGVGCVS
ncbi:hypothetical protein [Halobacillus mangrovi]|uniref:Uncharacterized protein n=1 Tax=Halobacillus mangrovi TaxID=402384 RepID=A0A1W5ZY99_9BACI|nr:hypothetical protein [Halobacillus mangrovi]ARI78234.1 hypothetical protein HM131_15855 [Halobacillus mangrovi]